MSACAHESTSLATIDWIDRQEVGALAISHWTLTEFAAAISIKTRNGDLDEAARATALASFARLASNNLEVLPVEAADFLSAARYADQHALGLRAGDALHLAICAAHGAAICTFDRRQSAACAPLGIRTVSIL